MVRASLGLRIKFIYQIVISDWILAQEIAFEIKRKRFFTHIRTQANHGTALVQRKHRCLVIGCVSLWIFE